MMVVVEGRICKQLGHFAWSSPQKTTKPTPQPTMTTAAVVTALTTVTNLQTNPETGEYPNQEARWTQVTRTGWGVPDKINNSNHNNHIVNSFCVETQTRQRANSVSNEDPQELTRIILCTEDPETIKINHQLKTTLKPLTSLKTIVQHKNVNNNICLGVHPWWPSLFARLEAAQRGCGASFKKPVEQT